MSRRTQPLVWAGFIRKRDRESKDRNSEMRCHFERNDSHPPIRSSFQSTAPTLSFIIKMAATLPLSSPHLDSDPQTQTRMDQETADKLNDQIDDELKVRKYCSKNLFLLSPVFE